MINLCGPFADVCAELPDPESAAVAALLHAVEQQLDSQGWDQPPVFGCVVRKPDGWGLLLLPLPPGVSGGEEIFTFLFNLSEHIDEVLSQIELPADRVGAWLIATEAWAATVPPEDVAGQDQLIAAAKAHRLQYESRAHEMRLVQACDATLSYSLRHSRGETDIELAVTEGTTDSVGRIPACLSVLMQSTLASL